MKKFLEIEEEAEKERKEIEEAIKRNGIDVLWICMKTLHIVVIIFMVIVAIYEIIAYYCKNKKQ